MRIIYALIIILFPAGFACGIFYSQLEINSLNDSLIGQKESYKQITDNLASLEVEYKNQSDIIKSYEKELSLKSDGQILGVSKSTFGVKGKSFTEQTGAGSYEIYLPNGDKKGPALGIVILGNLVTVRVYDHDYEIVQTTEKDKKTGRYKVLAKGYYILKEGSSEWKNKKFPLNVTGGSVVIDPTLGVLGKKKVHFKPRITAGLEWLKKDVLVSGMVFPISYGESPDVSDFRFLGIGLSGNKSSGIHVVASPVSMNLKKIIKPLRNTYIGPAIDIDGSGNIGFGAVLQLGL